VIAEKMANNFRRYFLMHPVYQTNVGTHCDVMV